MMSKPPGETQEEAIKIPDVLPVLPLKDTVVFPYIILPLSVGRDKSVLAVDRALAESRVIMLVAQRDAARDVRAVPTAGQAGLPEGRVDRPIRVEPRKRKWVTALAQIRRPVTIEGRARDEQTLEAESLTQSLAFASEDTREAVLAWIQKREPRFQGR